METVTIGCRLPHGILIEVGIENGGIAADGRPFPRLQRTEKYRKHQLRGTNALPHLFDPEGKRIEGKAVLNAPPYINTHVPKDLWDEWIKTHSGFLKHGHLFVVEGNSDASMKGNARAVSKDAMERPGILQPIDQTKIIVPGISKADFTKAA
jgi:hypothetical protein